MGRSPGRFDSLSGFSSNGGEKTLETINAMTAVAQQKQGYPDVVIKNSKGDLVTKVPNGELVTILTPTDQYEAAGDDADVKVSYQDTEGFAKKGNLKPEADMREVAPATAMTRQADGWDDVVLKEAPDETANIVIKVPNYEMVTILAERDGYIHVRWKDTEAKPQQTFEGFAKSTNLAHWPEALKSLPESWGVPLECDIHCFGRQLRDRSSWGESGPDARRRCEVLMETLVALATPERRLKLRKHAWNNLEKWRGAARIQTPATGKFPVFKGDWGDVTLHLTRTYGEEFAVLNMANAVVAGGGYTEGMPAQEENMFRRTDCHFFVDAREFDQENNRYRPEFTDIINAVDGKVLLDVDRERICIRGPEDGEVHDLGYPWLKREEIFSFLELRAAAVDLRDGNEDEFATVDCTNRIVAQLETLKERGIRHAVLSAFGCGAFLNPPETVAQCYCEALKSREQDFDCVAFAIFHPGYGPDNYVTFKQTFERYGMH